MNDEVRDDVRAYQTSDAITMHTYDDVSRKELVLVLYSSVVVVVSKTSSRKRSKKRLDKTPITRRRAARARRARAPSIVPSAAAASAATNAAATAGLCDMGVAGADAVPCATSASRAAADRPPPRAAPPPPIGTRERTPPSSRLRGAGRGGDDLRRLRETSASSSSSRIANVSPSAAPSAAARLKALSDGSDEPVSLDAPVRPVLLRGGDAVERAGVPGPRVAPATTLLARRARRRAT